MTASGEFDASPVRAFLPGPDLRVDESVWPASVPALAQVPRDGLELPAGLTVVRGVRPRWSYFLRADTMHQLYTYLEQNPGQSDDPWHQLSHGEGFLEILRTRVNQTGFYLMDEPDAPLSFTSLLGLAALLHDLVTAGSQLVVATHSPVLAAVPGANLLELGPWGIRPASWEDLSLVVAWRQFMRDPQGFFRHLFEA